MPHWLALSEVPLTPLRAVVVNIATELSTTVTVASLRTNAPEAAILVVNCDPSPESSVHFEHLAQEWAFDLVDVPVAWHGLTLDRVIDALRDDLLLLVDSDLELRDPSLVPGWRARLIAPEMLGVGWLQPGGVPLEVIEPGRVWHTVTRFWVALLLVRSSAVRAAREAGQSFGPLEVDPAANDERARATMGLRADEPLPDVQYYDTGARIYQWLVANGWSFVEHGIMDARYEATRPMAKTFRGLTTHLLKRGRRAHALRLAEHELRSTLSTRYGIDFRDFETPAWTWPEGYPPPADCAR